MRPEDVHCVWRAATAACAAEVVAVEPLGAETHLVVRIGEIELRARARGWSAPRSGETVRVAIDAARAHGLQRRRRG